MCYAWVVVCVMCWIDDVLCTVFSLHYKKFAITILVAWLRAYLASLGRDGPNKGRREGTKGNHNITIRKKTNIYIYIHMLGRH